MRKIFLTWLLVSSLCVLGAQDAPETPASGAADSLLQTYHPVEGLYQWQKSLDVSGLKPGTYNIVVTGEDTAGNTFETAAVDIRIDPESDKPLSSITYPSSRMRIAGDLSVLGSAKDDDQVAHVDVRLGQGEYIRAGGTDFWSADFSTQALEDGVYDLTCRATDINGIAGDEYTLSFILDRRAPQIAVTSHENGGLVSGKFNIEGSVRDTNGLSRVDFSYDQGQNWNSADLKGGGKDQDRKFTFPLDSREMADGPRVILIRGTDQQGSSANLALLLYLDNTKPELEIVYPAAEEPENGRFQVMGRATDETGVARLSWAYKGEESREIPLEPGNPYWAIDVDYTGQKKMALEFLLTDVADNTRRVVLERDLSWQEDLPRIELLHPREGVPTDDPRLMGWVLDDDGPGGVVYQIGKTPEVRQEGGRRFTLDLPGLPPGEHQITLRALDRYGVEGDPQVLTVSLLPREPQVSLDGFYTSGDETLAFKPGIRIRSNQHRGFYGTVHFDSGKGSVAVFSPDGSERELSLEKTDQAGTFRFTAPFSEPVSFGFYPLKLVARDGLGSEVTRVFPFWMEDLTVNLTPFGFSLSGQEEVVFHDRAVGWDFRFVGHPLKDWEIPGKPDFLELEVRGERLTLNASGPGRVRGLSIQGTTDRGTLFTAPLPPVLADFAPPELILETPPAVENLSGMVRLSGSVKDDLGPVTLFSSLDGGELKPLNTGVSPEPGEPQEFTLTVPADSLKVTGSILRVSARDVSGKESSSYLVLSRRAAEGESVKPSLTGFVGGTEGGILRGDLMDGGIFLGARAAGVDSLSTLTYQLDGDNPRPLAFSAGLPQETILLPSPGAHQIVFRAGYGEGKTLTATVKFTVAGGAPVFFFPEVYSGQDVVRKSGMGLKIGWAGPAEPEVFECRVDGELIDTPRYVQEGDRGIFSLPLEDLSYGPHTLEVHGKDDFGREAAGKIHFYLLEDPAGRHRDSEPGLYILEEAVGDYAYLFQGREIVSAELDPREGNFAVDRDGAILRIRGGEPERSENRTVVVTTEDQEVFRLEGRTFTSDVTPPVLTLEPGSADPYVGSEINLTGTLQDDLALDRLEYSLSGSSFTALPFSRTPDTGDIQEEEDEAEPLVREDPADGSFWAAIDLRGVADGPLSLTVRARDTSGNETVVERLLVKDTLPPRLKQILPDPAEDINGRTSLFFRVDDAWGEDFSGSFTLGETETPVEARDGFIRLGPDFSPYQELPELFDLKVKDSGTNLVSQRPSVSFEPAADKPVVAIQFPQADALFQEDPLFSGTVRDDDGVKEIQYRVDGGDFLSLPGAGRFEIRLPFSSLGDNGHEIEVVAYDLEGVPSDPLILPFRISREVPEAALMAPELGTTNRGEVVLTGTAGDANGISAVFLSLDNGNSYHLAEGREAWSYPLNSRVLVDGTYMILIKALDGYGVESLSSGLLTVDNTAPYMNASQPVDGVVVSDFLSLQLRTTDELSVRRLRYVITPLETPLPEPESGGGGADLAEAAEAGSAAGEKPVLTGELPVSRVVLEQIDVTALEPGLYNFSVFAYDAAANESIISRDFEKQEPGVANRIDLLYPLTGATLTAGFGLSGRVSGDDIPGQVEIFMDGRLFDRVEVKADGFFTRRMEPEEMTEGSRSLSARFTDSQGTVLESRPVTMEYRTEGPWVSIDSVSTGSYVSNRPWIRGTAGYSAADPEEGRRENRDLLKSRELVKLEYSLDNGRNFSEMKAREEWRFRLETQDLPDGPLSILVRGEFRNGEKAVSQAFVFADDTPPRITLLTPDEGSALNQELEISGTAEDENGLRQIQVMLRAKSKSSYEVPQFIQGLFLDTHFLGATYYELGLGLTFFDNNVKIQGIFGKAPPGRFNGNVFGVKLLANVATLPYGYFFGPDWNFLSSSVALGAAFEYFTMTEGDTEENGLVLGAAILQLELLKFSLDHRTFLNGLSAYLENQFWFISSDIQGGIEYRLALGLRANIF